MRCLLSLWLICLPLIAAAQTDDRDYLTAFLEDNLSDAGREVIVTGFAGALSSQATITQLTIADDQGIWLTLNGVALDWNRGALLSGRLSVNALTADEIIVARMPVADDDLPSPEASGFSLPELPVSVDIGQLAATRIVLGDTILGEAVEGSLDASLSLEGGEGRGSLTLLRTDDGPAGQIDLSGSYANATGQLILDLKAEEAANGIAVRLLGLPGAPSALLAVQGAGPINNFSAAVSLQTDGLDRLAGAISVKKDEDGTARFITALNGDLAPLFVPEYAAFFGDQISLVADGTRRPTGQVVIDSLLFNTRALQLNGSLALAPDGLPERFVLTGKLGLADGTPVLLPFPGEDETRLTSADLTVSFDASQGDGWRGSAVVVGLDRADVDVAGLSLTGSGRIARLPAGRSVGAVVQFQTAGLMVADPDLATALGPLLKGDATLSWQEDTNNLRLSQLTLDGQGYGLRIRGLIDGLEDGLRVTGDATARVDDLGRLSGLIGQPIGGSADLAIRGTGSVLGGDFDIAADLKGQDLRTGQTELDGLLTGASKIALSATRDANGTELRALTINAGTLTASAKGTIASDVSAISVDLDFRDLSVLGAGYRGSLTGKADLSGTLADGRISLDAQAQGLAVGQPEADKLLRGQSRLAVDLALKDGTTQIQSVAVSNPQFEATATGTLNGGTQNIDLSARLANLGLLLPDFPGPLSVSGTAIGGLGGYALNLRGQGPGQISATVDGTVSTGFSTANLKLAGSAQAGLANAFLGSRVISGPMQFDLALNGPLALQSLSGQVSLANARISDPAVNFGLQDVNGTAQLRGGQAQIVGQANVSSGGQVQLAGSVGLLPPFTADLTLAVNSVTLRDAQLYETTANGTIKITGPMVGGGQIAGQIALGTTELRIPSTGFGGAGLIIDLRHVNEPAAVRQTRARAGLLGGPGNGGGTTSRPFALDLTVTAPARVFIRGRGLDAELGGQLQLQGTTANVIPSGAFSLIRGRLDLLGKRLNLSEATLLLEGEFVPFVRIMASNDSDGITSSVLIEGSATNPDVTFTSNPELPQEEVLARLLFGRGLDTLSPLQAAQLAGAVASLAGKGGEGVIGRLRSGFGLDDLDLQTASDGGTSLTFGKYIAKNVYTEITVDQKGESQINLNLDLKPTLTLRGRASTDGNTGIGIFLEKDY